MAHPELPNSNLLETVNLLDEKPEDKLLSTKEKAFAAHYLIYLNKTKAAASIGASIVSAHSRGYDIYNRPHVKKFITDTLKERVPSIEETVKLISDTAQGNITDYFVPVTTLKIPQIKVSLSHLIISRRQYVRREREFADRKGLTEKAYDDFMEKLQYVNDEILRYEIELEANPDAYRIIDGEPELVHEMKLDINSLVADKERGKVKKVKYKEDGSIEVEMYDAQAAADKLMKYHGAYAAEKTDITSGGKPISSVVIFKLPDNGRDKDNTAAAGVSGEGVKQ